LILIKHHFLNLIVKIIFSQNLYLIFQFL
ncbi:hypothetical protein KSS87_018029, partial [Heliosperma pusillum]